MWHLTRKFNISSCYSALALSTINYLPAWGPTDAAMASMQSKGTMHAHLGTHTHTQHTIHKTSQLLCDTRRPDTGQCLAKFPRHSSLGTHCVVICESYMCLSTTIHLQSTWGRDGLESQTPPVKEQHVQEIKATLMVPLQLWQTPLTKSRKIRNRCQVSLNSIILQQI